MYDYDQEQHPIMGEAPALVAPPPLPRPAPLVSLNGVPSDGLRLVVRTATVNLSGDYTGFWAKMRLNPRRRVLDEISSGDTKRACAGLAAIIVTWNFRDEDGQPVEPTEENVYDLPDDMMGQLVRGYFAQFQGETTVPKP